MTRELSLVEKDAFIEKLKIRFSQNMHRHDGIEWRAIQGRLEQDKQKTWSLHQMELTGGEPDVVCYDLSIDKYYFYDCSTESPEGRRSLCYDRPALESRKTNVPRNSVIDLAQEMGVELLLESQYHFLQQLGTFDTKTSSWLKTPFELRALGGAIFGDYRFGRVFVYHNGAQSYYAARGFRCCVKV